MQRRLMMMPTKMTLVRTLRSKRTIIRTKIVSMQKQSAMNIIEQLGILRQKPRST